MYGTNISIEILFPAYAGVIPRRTTPPSATTTFPRIRGGDPQNADDFEAQVKLFPAYAGVIPSAAGCPGCS